MMKRMDDPPPHDEQGLPRRSRRLRTIAMLPTLLTLGNLYFGFIAIYNCGREMFDSGKGVPAAAKRTLDTEFFETHAPSFLSIAVWMLIFAMICDALDGRIARLTKRASKFGEQLDSLADTVSFGVAPAMMMITLVRREINQLGYTPLFGRFGQLAVLIGAIYACCAVLRLARFNVETSLDESAHRGFKGLPSPGAAGGIIGAILLHEHLDMIGGWPGLAGAMMRLLPFLTLGLALLMVSRIPYSHAANSFLRRRPIGHVVIVLLVVPLLVIWSNQTLFLMAWAFVLSGPIRLLFRRRVPPAGPAMPGAAGPPATGESNPRSSSVEF